MMLPNYEIYAIKYAWRDAKRTNHFVGGDPHDASMPMDYFVWLVRNAERTIVIDTGFTQSMAEQRKRIFLRTPAEGLAQNSDAGALAAIVAEVLAANADAAAQYRAGKPQAFGFLVGQVMKASGGKANPKLANQVLRDALALAPPGPQP